MHLVSNCSVCMGLTAENRPHSCGLAEAWKCFVHVGLTAENRFSCRFLLVLKYCVCGLTTQNRSCCVLVTVQNLCSMSTHYKPAVPVVHRFTGGPNGFQQCEVPIIIKTLHHLALSCYSFQTIQLLLEDSNWYYHQYLDTLDDRVPSASHDYSRNLFLVSCYCTKVTRSDRRAERLLVHIRAVLHGLLQKHYEMRVSFLHSDFYIWVLTK
jgi:hypothetical protein